MNTNESKVIKTIALTAIMFATVLVAMVPMGSAVSKGDNFNYIGNTTFPVQKVLIGQNLQFNLSEPANNFSSPPTVYRYVAGELVTVYSPDSNGRMYNVNWPTTGAYYASDNPSEPQSQAQLSVSNPNIPLTLKVGNKTMSTITVGTPLRVDTGGINLFDEDKVDLKIIDPDGNMIVYVNNQNFRNITVAALKEFGNATNTSAQINTIGWRFGTYTFQIKTSPEYACGLDAVSYKKILTIRNPEVKIDASKTETCINEMIILTIHAPPYHNIAVESSYPFRTVFEGGKYDYSGPGTGGPINDVMDEDGIKHYAVHFTDTGAYTIFIEDLDEWFISDSIDLIVSSLPEKLTLKIEDVNNIRVNFSTYLLDDDRLDLKLINPEGTTLSFNPTNPSQSFCNITVQAVKGMLINTSGWNFGTYTTWIETNKSYIPVLEVHSNPVVFEIDSDKPRLVPTVFFFDYEPPYQGEDGGMLTIGDDILLYGTATGNSTVDIAINNEIVRTDIPIQESGSFVDVLPSDNLTPRFNEIEAFVDTHFVLGEDVTVIENNGSSSIFLKSNESILSLYGGTVIIGNDLTIRGTATGGNSIDIAIEDEVVAINVLVGAGGEFEVTLPTPATPHTDTIGMKRIKAFIDTPFSLGENVSEAASSGDSSVFLVEGVPDGEIGVFAEENETVELHRVRIAIIGTPSHNITVDSSDYTHTIFPCGLLDNPCPEPSLPFNHRIDADGVRDYAVRFNDTGTYTITITDIDTGNTDSLDILVEEKKVIFDIVTNCTVGDRLLIKGTANTGSYVTIAVDDYVYPGLDGLVIQVNKQFLRYIDTATTWGAGTAFQVPGYHRLEAFIDRPRAPIYPDIIAPTETDDGNTMVLLTNQTLSAYLSKNEVFKETGFRIWGIAPGSKSVDILTISPRGGNGTALDGIPHFLGTNVTGITFWTASVSESNHGFVKRMWVHPDADSGTYAIMVTTSGLNGTYDGVNNFSLLDGIVETYCGGNPEVLGLLTQKELFEMVKNATINASGSDDLLQELHLSVAESVPKVIYVPDNYAKIQWAVENASFGDTIIVRDGIYTENVKLNKSNLTIISENGADKTVINASNPNDYPLEITANYTTISGFTIKCATYVFRSGIYLENANHCNISNNIVSNNYQGIYFNESKNNILENNTISNNWAESITLLNSSNNRLKSNVISNNSLGIRISRSSYNILTQNNLSNNAHNLSCFGYSKTDFDNEIDTTNTINGKPIYYYFDQKDRVIEKINTSWMGLAYCSNFTIRNNDISHGEGISFVCCDNSTITKNRIYNTTGNAFYKSNANVISENEIYNNTRGLSLHFSDNNEIINNCVNSNLYGISLYYSKSNNMRKNNLSNKYKNFEILGNSKTHYNNTIDETNTLEGLPLYYYYDERDLTIKDIKTYYMEIAGCDNLTIRNSDIRDLKISFSNQSTILANNISNEMSFYVSNNITALKNNITDSVRIALSNNNTIQDNVMNSSWIYPSSSSVLIVNNVIKNGGISCGYSSDLIIENNIIMDCRCGVECFLFPLPPGPPPIPIIGLFLYIDTPSPPSNPVTQGIVITGNEILKNTHGIRLGWIAYNTTIANNNISDNKQGILLEYVHNCKITNNTISNNVNGIGLQWFCYDNRIYNNYFSNTNNAYDDGNNIWNITKTHGTNIIGGPYLGGNYWSDYAGEDLDGDGLGDTPYNIAGGTNKDYLPLVAPSVFNTGKGTYPSIMGIHNGTFIPSRNINVSKLYTYSCAGTGGHTEYVKIWNSTSWNVTATWKGYVGDWHNISFDEPFTLEGGKTYNYTIITGSYPQIHHTNALLTPDGWINCTEFTDANGKRYTDWIPAIKLE